MPGLNRYEVYDKDKITRDLLNGIKVGDFIKINTWKRPFTVTAVSDNYFIMCKPHFNTYAYSICEKNKRGYEHNLIYRPHCGFKSDEFICGPDNYFTRYDYFDFQECQKALKDLESGDMEVSERHGWGIWHIEIKRK